jgi:hypothetical protein
MPKGVNTHHHAKGGKEGLKMPMGNSHWEEKPGDTEMANGKYIEDRVSGNPIQLKESVNALASYTKKNKMKY